ncbi:MAG: hypothetical protein KAH97_07760, partial [Anaerolineales bacterium]|nr:hypothetical protein [Anaerolineales bacterium]
MKPGRVYDSRSESHDQGRNKIFQGYPRSMIIILMGVSGSGKTTVGSLLADELGWEFLDGDEYHSPGGVT